MPIARHSRSLADIPVLPLEHGEFKQQWVYRQIAGAIESGLLRPGDSVPSTRALAARWGTSRGVVELAFEQLGQQGYLQARTGKGTKVCDPLPGVFLQAGQPAKVTPQAPTADDTASPASLVSRTHAGKPFVARLPDLAAFDLKAWQQCVSRAALQLDAATLGDADPQGIVALREGICKHLALSRGILCAAAEVMVVTGIRHAIDLCAQVLLPEQAAVALEAPGYAGAEAIFALRGRRMLRVAVDEEGMDVAQLRRGDAVLAYVTPAHQAPTGVSMSPRRREQLMAWAVECGAWILEDDYDSDFSYETAPLPALKSQDPAGRVLFCGSFNKSLFPGLRIGYIVAARPVMASLVRARAATGRSNPILDQLALLAFMRSGELLRQLKRTRVTHKARRDIVLREFLAAGWPQSAFQGTHAGLHFVLRLPAHADETRICARAAEAGIQLEGLGACQRADTPGDPPGLVIGYAALSDAQARWSARQLAYLLKSEGCGPAVP